MAFVDSIDRELGGSAEGPTFSARQDIFASALEEHLPRHYPDAVSLLERILGPPLPGPEGMFTYGWWLWPVGRYIERNALADREVSLGFIYKLTQRFTGEFAVRPLLRDAPEDTLSVLDTWAQDPDVHVRRLASEGMRINLPWAQKLTVALDYFDSYRTVLDRLKSAPEKFVQKSVGNNLNDLMKNDAEKAWAIIEAWRAESPSVETEWIIRHGTRSLRKRK
ncbi:MAG: DNA alkylation repair protein [Spirochaetaceae bacterium]|nr:MAG: DNA alkylation repair protein [Spirochaetaceae bacterium]